MIICSFGAGSDVHLCTSEDGYACVECSLNGGNRYLPTSIDVRFMTRGGVIEHLKRHARSGHKVPLEALQRLQREIDGAKKAESENEA